MTGMAGAPRARRPRWRDSPWIAVPATLVVSAFLLWAWLAVSGMAAGTMRGLQCIGYETLLCGKPPTTQKVPQG